MGRAPWAERVLEELFDGVVEWVDPGENPRILEYFAVGCPGYRPEQGDETPWCAALLWWALVEGGAEVPEGRPPLARALLEAGSRVVEPRPGDLAVLWRGDPDGWQGHAGVYLGRATQDRIYLAGGNQGNRVSVQTFDEVRLLSYIRPHRKLEEV